MPKITDEQMRLKNVECMRNVLNWMAKTDATLMPKDHADKIHQCIGSVDEASSLLTFMSLFLATTDSGLDTLLRSIEITRDQIHPINLLNIAKKGEWD